MRPPSYGIAPPPYGGNSRSADRPSVTALTFFLFDVDVDSRTPIRSDTTTNPLQNAVVAEALPPAYAETPRTQAERLFWIGWLFPPFLWIIGVSRIWRTETAGAVGDKRRPGETTFDEEAGPDVQEALERWRQEELVWARRCLWAFIGSVLLAALLGVMLANVTRRL